MDDAPHYLPAQDWEPVETLPQEWAWQQGWRYVKRLGLTNPTAHQRTNEPIEMDLEVYTGQISDPEREIRVVQVLGDNGPVKEIPSQVHQLAAASDIYYLRLFFLADLAPEGRSTYLIFYGNPAAAAPAYHTDLAIGGQGCGLSVENLHFRIELAPSMGQLKNIFFKTLPEVSHEPSAAITGFGPPMDGGHGVEGTVHWGPDWSDQHVGRYRITNWETPPNYSVLRGPVCLRLRRWGHPILALGPGVGRWHQVTATVTYTFFAASPYFLMESRLDVLEEAHFRDCRNDEWVGMIPALPETAWMTRDGTIGYGPKSWRRQDPAWMTYFNRTTGDGFATLHLEQACSHPAWSQPDLVSLQPSSMRLRTRGAWVRYPLRDATMRPGDFVREKNAYLLHQVKQPRDSGFGMLMDYHHRLTRPAEQTQLLPAPQPLTQANIFEALKGCYDHEVYIEGTLWGQRLLSVVDLGLVRQVEINGSDLRIALVMPYRGRETWFGWFADNIEGQLRQRLAGVGGIDVELVKDPPWAPEQMNARARRLLGLPTSE